MTTGIYDEKRLKLLDLLPEDWIDRIADKFEGVIPTIFPDQAEVYAGNDKECIAALKKYGLYTLEIQNFMEG